MRVQVWPQRHRIRALRKVPSKNMKKKLAAPKNYMGEWFGHRVYPQVKCATVPISEFSSSKCPFLSASTQTTRECVKSDNSKGVCTITTTTGTTKDWIVCPYPSLYLKI